VKADRRILRVIVIVQDILFRHGYGAELNMVSLSLALWAGDDLWLACRGLTHGRCEDSKSSQDGILPRIVGPNKDVEPAQMQAKLAECLEMYEVYSSKPV
jgi:hypothetical protein